MERMNETDGLRRIRVETEYGMRDVLWPEGVEYVAGLIQMRGRIPEATALHIENYGGTELLHPISRVGWICGCLCPDCVQERGKLD